MLTISRLSGYRLHLTALAAVGKAASSILRRRPLTERIEEASHRRAIWHARSVINFLNVTLDADSTDGLPGEWNSLRRPLLWTARHLH